MPKTTIRINASALKKSACKLAFWLAVIEGYKWDVQYNDTEFGTAFHLFAKRMYETAGNVGIAMQDAREYFNNVKCLVRSKKDYLTDLHLMKVSSAYWSWMQDKQGDFELFTYSDGKPACEVTFSNLFYEDEDYEVRLEGTIDRIGKFKGSNGQTCFRDYKTTSRHDRTAFFNSYELDTQMRYYLFNMQLAGRLAPESFLGSLCKLPVGCIVDGIFLMGADKTEFESSRIMTFNKDDMDEMGLMLSNFVADLLARHKAGVKPYREGLLNGACNLVFGTCDFALSCKQPDAISRQHILKQKYKQETYMPLREN